MSEPVTTDNFDFWNGDVPLLSNGDPDFELWNGDVPLLDAGPQAGQTAGGRRRAFVIQQIYGND